VWSGAWSYADDILGASSDLESIKGAFASLNSSLRVIGLRTNSKSILFTEKHSAEAEAAAAEMGIQFAHGAIDVLGGPVGTQEDSKSIVRASLEKIISGINNFGYLLKSPTEALDEGNLLDPQLALGAITKALNARVTFLARAASAEMISDQLANFDQAINRLLGQLIDPMADGPSLPALGGIVRSLPLRVGGLGCYSFAGEYHQYQTKSAAIQTIKALDSFRDESEGFGFAARQILNDRLEAEVRPSLDDTRTLADSCGYVRTNPEISLREELENVRQQSEKDYNERVDKVMQPHTQRGSGTRISRYERQRNRGVEPFKFGSITPEDQIDSANELTAHKKRFAISQEQRARTLLALLLANPATRAKGAWFQSHLLQTSKISPLTWRGYITSANRLGPATTRGALERDLLCHLVPESHRDELDPTKCKNGKSFLSPQDAFHDLSCAGSEDPQYVHRTPLHNALIDASCHLLKDEALARAVTRQSVKDAELHYPTGDYTKNNSNSPAGVGNDDPNSGRTEDASQDPAILSQDTDEQGVDLSPSNGQEDPNHAPPVNQAQRPPVRAEENRERIQGRPTYVDFVYEIQAQGNRNPIQVFCDASVVNPASASAALFASTSERRQYKEEHDGQEYSGPKKNSLRPRADEAAVQMIETKLLKYGRAWSDYKDEERFRGQEQPIVECWVFDITGKPSDELRHILRKLQADDPGGAKRKRILTYLTKVRTLCARAYGAPAIRGPIRDSYLSFLPTRVH